MITSPSIPHCRSCTCVAYWQPVSTVRLLPVDLARMETYPIRHPTTAESGTQHRLRWRPDRHNRLAGRATQYRAMIEDGEARNIREAVKMLAVARREWRTAETRRYAEVLHRRQVQRSKPAYERALLRKKEIVRVEGDGRCTYCGAPGARSVDHILPTSRGGDHRRKNLALSCVSCNSEKRDRTPDEWKAARLGAGLPWPPLPRTSRYAS